MSIADKLTKIDEIEIGVVGRKSGRAISLPVWFIAEKDNVYLLPSRGSDTQWYKNMLENPSITIHASGLDETFDGVPVAEAAQVDSIVEKFRSRYGDDGIKLYSKLDVAVLAKPHVQ
jgi:deazaflavin-dependent oxidoreductase (nitroreductase family)